MSSLSHVLASTPSSPCLVTVPCCPKHRKAVFHAECGIMSSRSYSTSSVIIIAKLLEVKNFAKEFAKHKSPGMSLIAHTHTEIGCLCILSAMPASLNILYHYHVSLNLKTQLSLTMPIVAHQPYSNFSVVI